MTFKKEEEFETNVCFCKSLRDEFRLRNLTLKHTRARLFVTSECGPRFFYPVWTTLWALYHLLNLLLMPYYSDQWPNPLPWPLYLTNLGYALLGLFSICDCIVTIYVHVKRPDILSGTSCESPWYIQLTWCLYNLNNVVSLTITLSYYGLLTVGFDPPSIITHMINAFFTITNILVCAKPTRLLHIYQPYLFSTAYIILSLIYHAAGGSAIYTVLDWNKISVALPTSVLVAFVLGTIVHILVFVLFKVRVLVRNRMCNEKKIDIIDIPVEEHDVEKCKMENKH
uniref:Protein rolling stone-like n=1 Tax=Crassostrea virginica TaxID=6565 RepID=A0A8B8BF28_CRAVI|nr:protein rolling stone-like [Crassostrea virginica]